MALYGPARQGWPLGVDGGEGAADGAAPPRMPPHAGPAALPPGASPPAPRRGMAGAGLAPPAAALGPRAASAPLLDGYREAYRLMASGLAGGSGRALYPPGHPFYTRAESAEALRAENDRLRKEVADLRARLGEGGDADGGGPVPPAAQPPRAGLA